ncbi:MAG: response regulator [Rhodobacteraceae bacterium]|jgi:DNA-binding response OmpR family regulator|nr:response regulator [Paracoccaceae bacterium]
MDKRVLLIEDEPSLIEAIRFILTRAGWSVQTHSDGASAVARIREARPRVLILDVMLPGRSGFDILDELRADPEFAALPVLMLTARGQYADRERAERAGVSRFMSKPFSNAEVLDSVNALAGAG